MTINEEPSARETILVVEDDDGVCYLQCQALRRAGFEVLSAASESGATSLATAGNVDLVVLDYNLTSARTGLDLYADWKSSGLDLPVVMVTAFGHQATIIQALRAGVRDFVTKSDEYLQYLPEAIRRVLHQIRTEKRLADSEARFQAFMDNSPAMAFIKDANGRMLYGNRLYSQLFRPLEWEGKTDRELHAGEVADQLEANDQRVFDSGVPHEFVEVFTLPNGAKSHWLTNKFPMTRSNGTMLLGGVAVDITQRIRADQELKQRDEQLRQAQKMEAVGTLAGGVAHEFNNLLQAIQGYTRFAMEGLAPDEQRFDDLQQVISASQRAADLTGQLLGFGRRQMLQFTDVEPNGLVTDLVKMLRPLIGEHITMKLSIDPQVRSLHADAGYVQQILMNLCLNARDAMPSGGELLIKTEALLVSEAYATFYPDMNPGPYLALTVADTGSGIAPENTDRIFEPFFTTKEVGKGTGLGLAMVYGAVQQHHGAIRVYSELGQGTAFKIYLPSQREDTENRDDAHADALIGGSETILVAEDDRFVRELALRILSEAGYKTIVAQNGVEAIRLFQEHASEIHLVLLDIVMPKLGGREAYQQIRMIKPHVPAIFCSGYDAETAQVGFVVREGLRLIQKPFAPEAMLQTIREVLDGALCQTS